MVSTDSPRSQTLISQPDRFLWIGLAAALILRVVVMLVVFRTAETYSGDGPFYIVNAQELWRILNIPAPDAPRDYIYLRHTTSIGPLYPLFIAPFYRLIPDSAPVAQALGTRLAQAVLDTLIAYLVYRIAHHLFGRRVARVALVAQALDLRYVFTAGSIATETLFLTLFIAFMWLYLRASMPEEGPPKLATYRWAGLLLGLSLLTRPVPLLFPVVLMVHGWLARVANRSARRRLWLRGSLWTSLVALALILPWMVRSAYLKGEFIPLIDTAFVHFYRSTREDGDELSSDQALEEAMAEDTGYGATDTNTEGDEYIEAGVSYIREAPFKWLGRIASDTVMSLLQPYGTVIATPRGAGIRSVAADFLHGEASLIDVLTVPGFWRRLAMYVSHYWGLIGGLIGFGLLVRRRWWEIFPLAVWALYVVGLISVLLVEPRYLFPMMFVLTVFAAYAAVAGWDWLKERGYLPVWLNRTRQSA